MALLIQSPLYATDPIDVDPDPDTVTIEIKTTVQASEEEDFIARLPRGQRYIYTVITEEGSTETRKIDKR